MATSSASLTPTNGSDASFRAWGSWVSAQLAAFGWVHTADTDQIDWETATKPTGANEVRGYEMWRMNDALQATAPVFLKLEYGSSGGWDQPGVFVTVGQGSNGAGALVGLSSARSHVRSVAAGGTRQDCVASGGPGRFQIAMFVAGVNQSSFYAWWLSVERTKNASGADTPEGVLIASATAGGTNAQQQFLQSGGGAAPLEASLGVLVPTVGTGSSGQAIAIYPVFWSKGVFLNPGLGIMVGFIANLTPGMAVTFSVYGSPHSFYVIGPTVTAIQRGSVANPITLLLRYE